MMTTTAMRKTKPAAAEPMMRGSFSWMLVLYSSIKRRNTNINIFPYTHTQADSHKLEHMDKHLSDCIWREQWVTDWHTAGWTNKLLGILTGCTDHFSEACWLSAQMRRVQTNHLAESVRSEQREHVWVRPRLIRQPRAGIQLLNGHTEAKPDTSLEHHKWHARYTTRWLPRCVLFVFYLEWHNTRLVVFSCLKTIYFTLIILPFENPLLVNRIRNLYLQSWSIRIFINIFLTYCVCEIYWTEQY